MRSGADDASLSASHRKTYGTDGHGRDGGEDGARGDMPQNQTIEPQWQVLNSARA